MTTEQRMDRPCPVEDAIALLAGKWRLLILFQLVPAPRRFGELQRALAPVTQKVLTGALRGMEQDGLVRRESLPGASPHATYALTDQARELAPIFDALTAWGERRAMARTADAIA